MIIAVIAKGLSSIILFTSPKKNIQNNYHYTTNYNGKIVGILSIPFNHVFIFLTKNNAQPRKTKANIIAKTPKIIAEFKLSGLRKKGEITQAVNQAAAIVLRNSDSALY